MNIHSHIPTKVKSVSQVWQGCSSKLKLTTMRQRTKVQLRLIHRLRNKMVLSTLINHLQKQKLFLILLKGFHHLFPLTSQISAFPSFPSHLSFGFLQFRNLCFQCFSHLRNRRITCIRQLELAELERLLGLLEQPIGKEDLHALIFFKPSLPQPVIRSETELSHSRYNHFLDKLSVLSNPPSA